ncbi:hypothetical protein LXL04_004320 [Taraxacum kok-saghyz]
MLPKKKARCTCYDPGWTNSEGPASLANNLPCRFKSGVIWLGCIGLLDLTMPGLRSWSNSGRNKKSAFFCYDPGLVFESYQQPASSEFVQGYRLGCIGLLAALVRVSQTTCLRGIVQGDMVGVYWAARPFLLRPGLDQLRRPDVIRFESHQQPASAVLSKAIWLGCIGLLDLTTPGLRSWSNPGRRRQKLGTEPYDAEVSRTVPREGSGYLLELRPITTGKLRFGATPYSTIFIGVWGLRQRKIKAAYQLFLYTLLGYVFMLLAILLILFQIGTTDLQILLTTEFSKRRQIFLWIDFFASFSVKVPMVPVQSWLPEGHVEAPTAGSVILAGILLKLGTYGFLRFSLPMFPEATLCFTPFIYTLSAIAIIYTSLTTLRQIDLKKIIAYCYGSGS